MLAELGDSLEFLGDCELEMMSRDRLVERQRLRFEPGAGGGFGGVDEVGARSRAIRCRWQVVGNGGVLGTGFGDLVHHAVGPGETAEPIGDRRSSPVHGVLGVGNHLFTVGEPERRVVAEPVVDLG